MLSTTLRMVLAVCVLIYFVSIVFLINKKKLAMKYSLIWIISGIAMGILVAFPNVLIAVSHFFGIASEMNGLFTFLIGFIVCILMSLTVIVSVQSDKIRKLTQVIGIMDKKINDILDERKTD